MNISDLKIGQLIWLHHQRIFDFAGKARVEAVGYDWVVVRDGRPDNNTPWLLGEEDYFDNYIGQDDEL